MSITVKNGDETGSNLKKSKTKTIKRNPSAKNKQKAEMATHLDSISTTVVGFKPIITDPKQSKPTVTFNFEEQEIVTKPVKTNLNQSTESGGEIKKKNFIELNKMRVRTQSQNSGKATE